MFLFSYFFTFNLSTPNGSTINLFFFLDLRSNNHLIFRCNE